jgi:hypothetical protein
LIFVYTCAALCSQRRDRAPRSEGEWARESLGLSVCGPARRPCGGSVANPVFKVRQKARL